MQSSGLILLLSLLLVHLSGCGEPAIRLHLMPGFTGQVIVDCGGNDDAATIQIDAQGHGRGAVCPREGARVFLDRNGSSTRIDDVQWLRTGDGFIAQFRLDVR